VHRAISPGFGDRAAIFCHYSVQLVIRLRNLIHYLDQNRGPSCTHMIQYTYRGRGTRSRGLGSLSSRRCGVTSRQRERGGGRSRLRDFHGPGLGVRHAAARAHCCFSLSKFAGAQVGAVSLAPIAARG